MNPILLSFLCGAAFIGGGVAVTVLVLFFSNHNKVTTEKWHDECMEHWKEIASIQLSIADSLKRLVAEAKDANDICRKN